MKTTRKGFTLIELIVVIAIIGVLAAILVPTMLGYVRKSKLSSAGSTASSIYKAVNSALTEMDEEDYDIGDVYKLTFTYVKGGHGTWSSSAGSITHIKSATTGEDAAKVASVFEDKVRQFFADIDKCKRGAQAQIASGSCVAVACATDATYTGTYPGGVVTNKNYKSYSVGSATGSTALADALDAAYEKSGQKPAGNSNSNSGGAGAGAGQGS